MGGHAVAAVAGDGHVVGGGQAGDLHPLAGAAGAPRVGLQDVATASSDQFLHVVLGVLVLAAGHGNIQRVGQPAVAGLVVRAQRLLEPVAVELFVDAPPAQRLDAIKHLVGIDHEHTALTTHQRPRGLDAPDILLQRAAGHLDLDASHLLLHRLGDGALEMIEGAISIVVVIVPTHHGIGRDALAAGAQQLPARDPQAARHEIPDGYIQRSKGQVVDALHARILDLVPQPIPDAPRKEGVLSLKDRCQLPLHKQL